MRTDIARNRPGLQVGYHHFALFRGYLDSLPLETLGERYLETGGSLPQAKRTLSWVRDELIAASKRYQGETGVTQSSMARLLRLKPASLSVDERVRVSEVPSLEDFQAAFDPTSFYSESELIEEFQKRYGEDNDGVSPDLLRKVVRNERLRKTIRSAVSTLENWIAKTPKPGDPVTIWLDPVVVAPLRGIGIVTIADLVGLINIKGNLWYRRISGFGAVRAGRVIRWLQINRVLPIEERALIPYRQIAKRLPHIRQREFGIVPFGSFVPPSDIDGSLGINRGQDCMLPSAATDADAIHAWLEIKAENPKTRRAYLAQAERFLLWITLEKNRPLSSASPEDCREYLQFLIAVGQPGGEWPWQSVRADWIGSKAPRWSQEWRPFTGSMSDRSRAGTATILRSMFAWLVEMGYLRRNPWSAVRVPRVAGTICVDHALNERQWEAVLVQVDEMSRDERYYRLRVLLWIGGSGGLRLDEILRLRIENLMRTPDGSWWWKFAGKGGKEREVPLAPAVLGYLTDYMTARGCDPNPVAWAKELPVLTSLKDQYAQKTAGQPLCAKAVSNMLKGLFDRAADRLDDPIDEHQLRRASAHWLRHTAATRMVEKGAPVVVVQEILGHASSATTALYTHADRARKRQAVEAIV